MFAPHLKNDDTPIIVSSLPFLEEDEPFGVFTPDEEDLLLPKAVVLHFLNYPAVLGAFITSEHMLIPFDIAWSRW
jgi:hypothetical protein